MPQFYLAPESLKDKTFLLKGPEAFHVTKVLRYREGQTLVLFDGKGGRYEGVIQKIHGDGSVSGALTAILQAAQERKPASLRLYQGLLKASHWDLVLEKGTELGVEAFIPVLTPRTVVLLHEAERRKAKQERWSRVILAAAKQCQRPKLPELREPIEFREAVRGCQGLTLLAWEGLSGAAASGSLRLALREADQNRGRESLGINLFVGPEGGFTEEEVELAESLGAVVFGLGPRILRAETAAIAAVSLIQYELGSL